VEKCISPQGKVTYTENDCPPGWKSQTIRAPAPSGGGAVSSGAGVGSVPSEQPARGGAAQGAKPAAAPAPATKAAVAGAAPRGVTLNYYDIQGGDFETLLAALNANGGFHAKAEWKLSYAYTPKRAGRACSANPVTTQLELTMTMPRWNPPPGTSPALFARWQRYTAALRKHEEGHLEIGRDFEDALKRSLAVISERCEHLEARVKGIFDLLLEKHRKLDAEYDRTTAHGRTQGAEFR
jgi:predicted secreted Zn-dependent protease